MHVSFVPVFGEMLFLRCERVLFFPPQSKCKCHHQVTTGALGYQGCDPHFPQRGPHILSSHFPRLSSFKVLLQASGTKALQQNPLDDSSYY